MKADFGRIKGWVILLNNIFYFVPLSVTNTELYFFSPFSRSEGGTGDESSHFLPSYHIRVFKRYSAVAKQLFINGLLYVQHNVKYHEKVDYKLI